MLRECLNRWLREGAPIITCCFGPPHSNLAKVGVKGSNPFALFRFLKEIKGLSKGHLRVALPFLGLANTWSTRMTPEQAGRDDRLNTSRTMPRRAELIRVRLQCALPNWLGQTSGPAYRFRPGEFLHRDQQQPDGQEGRNDGYTAAMPAFCFGAGLEMPIRIRARTAFLPARFQVSKTSDSWLR